MLPTLLLSAAMAGTACPKTTFAFVGQPDCVALAYDDGRTQLTNACTSPLLIDESVQVRASGAAPSWLVEAQTETVIRDLNTFTIGMDGRIYRVVAIVEACDEASGRVGPEPR